MKKLHSLTLACVSLISIASYSPTYAGNRPGALTITPAIGHEYFANRRSMENTSLGAVMLGYNFTDHWGIEGYLGFFNTKFDASVNDNRQINGTLFAFDGVYHFMPECVLEPYLLAGVGIMDLNPSRTDANNEGNLNGAAGFQLFATKSIALRLEARDVYTIVGGKNDVIISAGISALIDMCK